MKKISSYTVILLVGFLLFGCTADSYDEMDITGISDTSIKEDAEKFGKQMAGNLRYVVTQMNKNGDDFDDLTKVKTVVAKYVSQYTNTPSISVEELDGIVRDKYYLTPVQLVFLEKINDAQAKSHTANEFMQYLKKIIEEIQATVPEIQQRNLLKMTVAMYYLTKEIDSLLKEGLMPVDLKQPQHIRLRSDTEGFWASLWAGACVATSAVGAELLAALEGMAFAAGVTITIVGACLLLTGDTDNMLSDAECEAMATACVNNPWKYVNGEWVRKECSNCRWYCLTNHKWNYNAC